ncbi:hypothetical protein TNCV_3568441 [Trichonephila clavipes]|nr:hypothetical protein TNCV_3568441 [Trichonephila clavipes]
MIILRIWNQWVQEDHTERPTGPQRPPTTNVQEDRHAIRLLIDWAGVILQPLRLTKRIIDKTAKNDLLIFVIQVQFNPMPNQIRAILAARGGTCDSENLHSTKLPRY